HEFAARLGVANSLEMFYALIGSEEAARDLLALTRDRSIGYRVLSHAVSLVKEQDDIEYQNPRDAAIATYLWVLIQTQPDLANMLSASALNTPRLWWARKVGLNFVRGEPGTSDSTTRIVGGTSDWRVSAMNDRDL